MQTVRFYGRSMPAGGLERIIQMLETQGAVVGTKQVLRAIQDGALQYIYIAGDAEPFLRNKLEAAANEHNIPVLLAPSMKELGKSCNIDVGAACAGILKQA